MSSSCGCCTHLDHAFHAFGCLECGAACCPSCAVALESVTYCRRCADSLLGAFAASQGTFELH